MMGDVIPIVVLGFFLGMRHATDADHVVAVTTVVSHQQPTRGAAAIGALWGIGHTITIVLVGGGIILFQWVIPPRLGLSMEFAVGVMLVVLGVLAFRKPLRHAATPHHDRLPRGLGGGAVRTARFAVVRPLLIGLVHGLAGSAGVALLVLTTISNPRWAMAYLMIFSLGTLVGMALVTMVIAMPFRVGGAGPSVQHALRVASGVLSIAVGLFVMYEMGIDRHLFAGMPAWTP